MASSFETLPIIDFQALENNATKPETLEKLKQALFNVGFLYLANTGLEASFPVRSLMRNARVNFLYVVTCRGNT